MVELSTRPSFVHPTRWLFEDGWSYCAEPFNDLLEAESLVSKDPWRTLLSLIERAKRGDFRSLQLLPVLLHEAEDYRLKQGAFLLLGAAAPAELLPELDRYLADDSGTWSDLAIDAVRWSGHLRFVEPLLSARPLAFGECARAGIDDALSELLSEDAVWVDYKTERRRGDDEVRARAKELERAFGESTAFYRGEPLDVRSVASDALAVLSWPDEDLVEVGPHLEAKLFRLETLTGVAPPRGLGSGFASDDPLVVEIRNAIEAARSMTLRTGRRTFFGHPVEGDVSKV